MQISSRSQTFDWAKTNGSWAYDYSYSIATNVNGYSYITGYFQDTAYFGSNMIVSAGDNDVFVAKYDKLGTCLWAKQAGSALAPDVGYAIALDNADNCYITGYYLDTIDFGSQKLYPLGWDDMFIAKYDANGNFQWAKRYGGGENDDGKGIAVDASGNIYASGYFWGNASFDSYNLSSAGWGDVFTAKFDQSGTCLWAKKGGGTGDDQGTAVCVDNSGNVFSTGFFKGNATFESNNLTSAGIEDIFIAKYDATGNLLWIKQAGNTGTDIGYAITADNAGNCYVTGYFNGTITMGSYTLVSSGANDIFIAKLDPNGNYIWAIRDGGVLNDIGYGLVLDDAGYLYNTGSFEGFATFGSVEFNSNGIGDIFVSCYNTDSIFQWAKHAGGTNQDDGFGVGVDTSGNCYITGDYMSYNVAFDTHVINNTGFTDGFVAKIGPPNQPPNALFSTSSSSICKGDCIDFTDNSSGAPTSWNWSFPGGNPSSSTAQNPTQICYDSTGYFDVSLIVSNSFGTDTLIEYAYIFVDSCTGIPENELWDGFSVYPNPGNGKFVIKFNRLMAGDIGVSVIDPAGREVYNNSLFLRNNTTEEIDISTLNSGVYFIKITSRAGSFIKRLLIE